MKILLTTDGSRYALAAARAVCDWIPALHGTVDVLAVMPRTHKSMNPSVVALRPHPTHGLGASPGRKRTQSGRAPRRALVLEWRGAAGRWVDAASALLRGRGVRVREILRSGDPAEVALIELQAQPYDLVVVGAKGRGDAPFFRAGSVAGALLERSPVPVLMVRARSTRRRALSKEHPLRILLAVDGGAESERAAERCARLFGGPAAHARVLVVANGAAGDLDRRKASIAARTTADRVRAGGLTAEPFVLDGEPAQRIHEAAQEADLVVMGARSVGPDGDRPLGGVSIEVARSSPCSVLVFRDGTPALHTAPKPPVETDEAALDVVYRGVQPSPAVEERARRAGAGLRKVAPDLIRSRMTIRLANGRRRKGNLYDIRLDLTVPGRQIEISRTPPAHREDETVLTAMDEAYAKARRALVEAGRVVESRRTGG